MRSNEITVGHGSVRAKAAMPAACCMVSRIKTRRASIPLLQLRERDPFRAKHSRILQCGNAIKCPIYVALKSELSYSSTLCVLIVVHHSSGKI